MIDTDAQRVPEKPLLVNLSGVTPRQNQPTRITDIIRNHRTFWTADELSEVLAISRKHVYKLAKSGRIPCYRMGGAIRFDPEDTAQWLEERAIAA